VTSEHVSQRPVDVTLEVITDPASSIITEIARLDQELFGTHKSLSEEDFSSILANGGMLFAHLNQNGIAISEASLVLNPSEQAETAIERSLPSWLAYCDGAAVSEDYRGLGLQKDLLRARESAAKDAGKEAIGASVRHRNLASIRSMFSAGYVMIADSPTFYGSSPEDARIFMLKEFSIESPAASHGLNFKVGKLVLAQNAILVPTVHSDEIDEDYNKTVGLILGNGYIGTSCGDIDDRSVNALRLSAMIFRPLGSMTESCGDAYAARQEQLKAIIGRS
jgi:ribosomal protein S18 acetylase RimI-like enzyme